MKIKSINCIMNYLIKPISSMDFDVNLFQKKHYNFVKYLILISYGEEYNASCGLLNIERRYNNIYNYLNRLLNDE